MTQPSITSISPTTGAPGLHVTIAGSYFGSSQGSVTFSSGKTASIYSWNSTQIVAIVPADTSTGNVTATVGGVQTNGSTFTAVAPPTASASAWPGPNGSGWNNTNVTVTFTCTAGYFTISSCSTPQNVTSEGSGQIITGGATDSNGDTAEASVTLNIDRTAPTLTISSPSDGDSTSSSSITVSGTVSDSRSGVSGVTCDGSATTVTSGSFSCNISLSVGVNLIVIQGTDDAGNVAAAILHITRTGSFTTTSLQVSPAVVNMVAGDTQQFNVVDQDGHARSDATWAVDDTDKATLPDENTPTLSAVSTGDVTLTATIGSTTATATIHVLSGTSLTDGTVRWSAPSPSGYSPTRVIQAQPASDGPDLFALLNNDSTNATLVQALTTDGQPLWETASSDFINGGSAPTPDGGIVMGMTNPANLEIPPYLTKLDARTGMRVWRYDGPNIVESPAIGHDGTVYAVVDEYPDFEYQLIALDGTTGSPRYRIKLPQTVIYTVARPGGCSAVGSFANIDPDGETRSQALPGSMVLSEDNHLYLIYGAANEELNYIDTDGNISCDASQYQQTGTVTLLTVQSDGQYTSTTVGEVQASCQVSSSYLGGTYSCTHPSVRAGTVIPDGDGGALLSWQTVDSTNEYHIAHVTASGVNNFDAPALATEMVLGEDGRAFGNDGHKLFAFDPSSGDVAWSYDAPSGNSASIVASTAENGLVAKLTNSSNVDTVIRFDAEGTPTSDSWTGGNLDYFIGDTFLGLTGASGPAVAYSAQPVDLSSAQWYMVDQAGSKRPRGIVTVTGFSQMGTHQTAIHAMVQEILTDLQNTSFAGSTVCKNWIETGSKGTDTISYLQGVLDNGDGWGHGTLLADGDSSGAVNIGAITALEGNSVDSGIRQAVFTVVNDTSGFFTSPPNGWGYPVGGRGDQGPYLGNGPKAQAAILFHELGHRLAIGSPSDKSPNDKFQNDNGSKEAVKANNHRVDAHCHAFIEALPSP